MSRALQRFLALSVVVVCACDTPSGNGTGEPAVDVTELGIGTMIGADDGPALFARIMDVATDTAGRVFVLDGIDARIAVFDSTGEHLFSFGRPGEGPGEMRAPCCMGIAPDGRLWVRDNGNGRYVGWQLFDDSAHAVATQRMVHSDANRHAPVIFDEAARVIDIGSRPLGDGPSVTHHFHLGDDGSLVRAHALPAPPADSLGMRMIRREMPDGKTMTMYTYPPYAPMELRAHGPGGEYAHGVSSHYVIDWRDADGTLVTTIRGEAGQGPEVTPGEAARADSQMISIAQRMGIPVGDLDMSTPAHKQPLQAIWFDADGRLWVELSRPENGARRAHVYGRSGTRVLDVAWPGPVALDAGAVRGTAFWGVGRDSLDVQFVVRLVPRG